MGHDPAECFECRARESGLESLGTGLLEVRAEHWHGEHRASGCCSQQQAGMAPAPAGCEGERVAVRELSSQPAALAQGSFRLGSDGNDFLCF